MYIHASSTIPCCWASNVNIIKSKITKMYKPWWKKCNSPLMLLPNLLPLLGPVQRLVGPSGPRFLFLLCPSATTLFWSVDWQRLRQRRSQKHSNPVKTHTLTCTHKCRQAPFIHRRWSTKTAGDSCTVTCIITNPTTFRAAFHLSLDYQSWPLSLPLSI